ncbi:hypothetical protein LPB137_08945 [Poseidonibacter parvus]|uniref:DUF309 domain-containing protein n=1 Tax=Poseidonibacter parvus TaxID=1850254 RepID=A0A1P8KN70_9BACT|nr:DUF309 domain-containing protein [Poseidonibacter parvus]APW65975.1 hypothetical protein LPB137_08945 [Poseidonibacter parvus]
MYDKTKFTQNLAIDRFIFAVKNNFFVEAHELLEDDWNLYKKQGEKKKALVLKGLINGATALALYFEKKRPAGYEKVWPVFYKYVPLLDEVDLDNKDRFYFAKELLIEKNKLVNN